MKSIFALIILLFASHASACAWDRDTLYEEEQGFEDIRDVIVGNFIRNPPKYFEMRLERISKILATDIDNLDLYDDASVACDRLHRFDEAIAWQERKKAALERLNYDGSKHKQPNHSYRHLANIGTHYVHRWLFHEDKWSDLADVEKARNFIKLAIYENPDAHFGREIYQLLLIEWIIRSHAEPRENPEDIYLVQDDQVAKKMILDDPSAASNGIAGLMRLGAGWRSVDLHAALAFALVHDKQRTNVALLSVARTMELYETGAVHLVGNTQFGKERDNEHFDVSNLAEDFDVYGLPRYQRKNMEFFEAYRKAVDGWHEARVSFMSKKFDKGQHPDTHPDFWNGFSLDKDRAVLPSSEPPLGEKIDNWWNRNYALFVVGGILLSPVILAAIVILLILRRGRKKKKALAARASA